MKLHFKTMVAAVVIASVAGMLFAQTSPKSLKSFATGGLYSDEVDDFASTTNWSGVNFNNVFVYADWNTAASQAISVNSTSNYVSLGAATKFDAFYLAGFYNFIGGTHDAAVLLGKEKAGFKIGLNVTEQGTQTASHIVTPYFYYGNRSVTDGKTSKLEVGAAVAIMGEQRSNENNKNTATAQPRYTIKPKVSYSSSDGIRTFGIGYDGALKLATEKVSTDSKNGKFGFDNIVNVRFTIKKSLADKFQLGFRTGADAGINFNTIQPAEKNKFDISVKPMVAIGGTATIVPGVFSVNVGASAAYNWPLFESNDPTSPKFQDTLRKGTMSFSAGAGMSFIMTESVGLDILAKVGTPSSIFNDVWTAINTVSGVAPFSAASTTAAIDPTIANYRTFINSLIGQFAVQCKIKF